MRYDRWISLNLPTQYYNYLRNSQGEKLPILMYHSVSIPKDNFSNKYFETVVSQNRFIQQMQWLRDYGYKSVPLHEFGKNDVGGSESATSKKFVLTFDDGLHDFYIYAFPVLQEMDFLATVYLVSGYIGKTSKKLQDQKCLTWDEVRELHKSGVEFGSHTVTHPQLWKLDRKEIRKELVDSKKTIEDKLGCPVDSFSYPYAFPEMDKDYVKYLRDILVECGYKNCVTTIIGTENTILRNYFLNRLPVNDHDDMLLFKAKLCGKYDWVHSFQYLKKFLFGIR